MSTIFRYGLRKMMIILHGVGGRSGEKDPREWRKHLTKGGPRIILRSFPFRETSVAEVGDASHECFLHW